MGAGGSCDCFGASDSTARGGSMGKSNLNTRVELGDQHKYNPLQNTDKESPDPVTQKPTTAPHLGGGKGKRKKLELSDFIMLRVSRPLTAPFLILIRLLEEALSGRFTS